MPYNPAMKLPGGSRGTEMTSQSAVSSPDIMDELMILKDEIADLCRRLEVVRLDIFGSAVHGRVDEESDVDLLVTFSGSSAGLFTRYFTLKEALQELLGRPVDLVTAESIRNPYLRADIDASRVNVYQRSYT